MTTPHDAERLALLARLGMTVDDPSLSNADLEARAEEVNADRGVKSEISRVVKDYILTDQNTSDITPLIVAAIAAGFTRIIIPPKATPWPMATKLTISNAHLAFKKTAQVSFNMATGYAMDITNVTITNGNFTSPFTGPITVGNQASYDTGARAIAVRSGCRINGMAAEYASWAPVDVQDGATNVRGWDINITNCRHYLGWASALHAAGSGVGDVAFENVRMTNCDRAMEIEAGASDILIDGFYCQNIGPNGWVGQSGGYATYTFVASVHSHLGEGACRNVRYRNGHIVDSAGGIMSLRSSGTNASDMPDSCTWENITIDGYTNANPGNNACYIQGINCKVVNLKMGLGSGITTQFNCVIVDGSIGSSIEVTRATAMALPFMKINETNCQQSTFKLTANGVTPTGSDWLISTASPSTTIVVNVDSVTGTLGYVLIDTTAHYSAIQSDFFKTAAGETFVQTFRVKGAKNCQIRGQGVATVNGSLDVFASNSATALIIDDFTVDRAGATSITLDSSTVSCIVGDAVSVGGGAISNASASNRVNRGVILPDASTNSSTARTYQGSGAPALSAPLGSYYLRTDTPGTASQRIYVCTTANVANVTSWTALI